MKTLEKENESLHAKLANSEATSLLEKVEQINDVHVLAEKVNVKDMNQLRHMIDDLKQQVNSGIILLGAEQNGKVQLAAGISKDLVDKGFHAGNLIKEAAKICGGGGGGRPDMAQAGGKNPQKLPEALSFVKQYVQEHVQA